MDEALQETQQQPAKIEETTLNPEEANATSPDKSQETSPLKSCRKSPLKRMKTLEEKDNIENQENIEATYIKANASTETEDKNNENCSDEEESVDSLEPRFLQPENRISNTVNDEQPKSLLGKQYQDSLDVTET